MYTQNNINAATGFGRFDLQLTGNGSILNVIFKVMRCCQTFRGNC